MGHFTHIVFNHIPKCAGSSLRHMLYHACLNHESLSRCPLYIPPYTHENMCLQQREDVADVIQKSTKVFFDHSSGYFFEEAFGLAPEATYRIISIRNPIHRFISHMYYFDKINPDYCSYKILKQKAAQYGLVFTHCLTDVYYHDQKLDIETRLNIAKNELAKYDFVFQVEYFRECLQRFNNTNPFGLRLEEQLLNESNSQLLDISTKTMLNIRKLLEPDIILLREYYPNINEAINH